MVRLIADKEQHKEVKQDGKLQEIFEEFKLLVNEQQFFMQSFTGKAPCSGSKFSQ